MKFLFRLISAVMLVSAAMSSCSHPAHTLSPYGWTPADARFDSLMLVAERFYATGHADSAAPVVGLMRFIADSHRSNRLLDSRTTYWEGRLRMSAGDLDGGTQLMRKALYMTDSAAHPYDYHRILWNLDMDYHDPTLERYRHLLSELDFFLGSGDKVISGAYAIEIGTFLNDLGDTSSGIPYLHMADSLLAEAGLDNAVSDNRINHVNALKIQGDTTSAEIILRTLIRDPFYPLTPASRSIALGNLYALVSDTTALREAYNIVRDKPLEQEAQCMYENFLCEEALKQGDMAMAKEYHRRAGISLQQTYRPDVIAEYYRLHSRLFAIEGRADSAYHYLYLTAGMTEALNSSDKDIEIRNVNLTHRIAEMKLQADIENRKNMLMFLTITFGLLLLIFFGGVLVYRHLQRQKLVQARNALRLERSNRKMMAMQLLMKEKENLLQAVGEEMNELSEQGEISRKAANRIGSSLKAHSGMQPERDNFLRTFDELDPSFSRLIRESHPSLTDADIRLATFIALGLDNKHIARVAGIRPESVKQARWRLRTKMGVATGESLEEAIRAFLAAPRK